jgi:multidrug efflux pump subunit AcrA (membrane-fusion protein)
MRIGVSADVVASQDLHRQFKGKIARTAQAVDPQSRTFRVEIDVSNSNRALVSGMYVQVSFALPSDGLLQVPAAALIFRATGPQVAIVGSDGRIQLRSVSIARDDGSTVLLTSGVALSEKVVLNLSSQVTEGQQVMVDEGIDTASNAGVTPKNRL